MKVARITPLFLIIIALGIIVFRSGRKVIPRDDSQPEISKTPSNQEIRRPRDDMDGSTKNFSMEQWKKTISAVADEVPVAVQNSDLLHSTNAEELLAVYQQEADIAKKIDLLTLAAVNTKDQDFAALFGPMFEQSLTEESVTDTLWCLLEERPMSVKMPILAYLCHAQGHAMQSLAYEELYQLLDESPAHNRSDLLAQIKNRLVNESHSE